MSISLTTDSIINVLTNGSKSATAISKEFGYTRKNDRVSKMIDEMVNAGTIEIDPLVKNVVSYRIVPQSEILYEVDKKENIKFEIPNNLYGYSIKEIKTGFEVTFPSGSTYQISNSERILVLNMEVNYKVDSPEQAIMFIKDYAEEKGFTHFLIKDVQAGKAISENEFNYNPVILFINVDRHSKSGF